MIRVLVWAKSAITRAGLEAIVRADPRFEIAENPGRTADLLSAMRESAPDAVLLDTSDTSIARSLPAVSALPAAPVSDGESPAQLDVIGRIARREFPARFTGLQSQGHTDEDSGKFG